MSFNRANSDASVYQSYGYGQVLSIGNSASVKWTMELSGTPGIDGVTKITPSATFGAGGVAPGDAQYLTLAYSGSLSAERVFTPSARFVGTDGGANSTYGLELAASGVTAASYTYSSITVDVYGRVTDASNGTTPVTAGGSGVAGYVAYFTGANTITGSARFTFDGEVTHNLTRSHSGETYSVVANGTTTGRCGWYLSNDTSNLHGLLYGTAATSTHITGVNKAALGVLESGAGPMLIGPASNNILYIQTNATLVAQFSTAGYFGVGTAPTELGHFYKSQDAITRVMVENPSTGTSTSNITSFKLQNATASASFGLYGDTVSGTYYTDINRASSAYLLATGGAIIIGSGASTPIVIAPGTTERARFTTDGMLGIGLGTVTPLAGIDQYATTTTLASHIIRIASATAASSASISLIHTRGTTTSPTNNSDGDELGRINFRGYTDDYRTAAAIYVTSGTGWGASGADAPGTLWLAVSPNASATPMAVVKITQDYLVSLQPDGAVLEFAGDGSAIGVAASGDVRLRSNAGVADVSWNGHPYSDYTAELLSWGADITSTTVSTGSGHFLQAWEPDAQVVLDNFTAGSNRDQQQLAIIQVLRPGVLRNLYVQLETASGASKTVTATVYHYTGGAWGATAITVAMTNATSGTDTSHVVECAAGDLVAVKITYTSSPAAPNVTRAFLQY